MNYFYGSVRMQVKGYLLSQYKNNFCAGIIIPANHKCALEMFSDIKYK